MAPLCRYKSIVKLHNLGNQTPFRKGGGKERKMGLGDSFNFGNVVPCYQLRLPSKPSVVVPDVNAMLLPRPLFYLTHASKS